MRTCPACGFPLDRRNMPAVCPKCDEDMIRAKARKPLVIDLAHRRRDIFAVAGEVGQGGKRVRLARPSVAQGDPRSWKRGGAGLRAILLRHLQSAKLLPAYRKRDDYSNQSAG